MSRYTGIDEIGRKEGAIGVFTARETHSHQRLSPGGDPGAGVRFIMPYQPLQA